MDTAYTLTNLKISRRLTMNMSTLISGSFFSHQLGSMCANLAIFSLNALVFLKLHDPLVKKVNLFIYIHLLNKSLLLGK
jgi:hypothetical protein